MDDFLDDPLPQPFILHLIRMLSSDHHRVHSNRSSIDVLNRHLRFPIRSQEIEDFLLPDFGQPTGQPMGIDDGHGHQLGRLVTGIAKHQSLIPGPLLVVFPLIHSLLDVGGLLIDRGDHCAGLPIEPHGRVIVSNLFDGPPDDGRHMDVTGSGNFTRNDGHPRRDHGLAGHPGIWILSDNRIQDAIGNLIGHLIGMSFGDRFRSEQKVCHCHAAFPPFLPSTLRVYVFESSV